MGRVQAVQIKKSFRQKRMHILPGCRHKLRDVVITASIASHIGFTINLGKGGRNAANVCRYRGPRIGRIESLEQPVAQVVYIVRCVPIELDIFAVLGQELAFSPAQSVEVPNHARKRPDSGSEGSPYVAVVQGKHILPVIAALLI